MNCYYKWARLKKMGTFVLTFFRVFLSSLCSPYRHSLFRYLRFRLILVGGISNLFDPTKTDPTLNICAMIDKLLKILLDLPYLRIYKYQAEYRRVNTLSSAYFFAIKKLKIYQKSEKLFETLFNEFRPLKFLI